jgi:adenosylmethionine-8-amino-7-oxononanoate aminotransferase
VHRQLDTLQHVSTVFANEPQAALAKKIASITPGGKLTKSFFTNSGTEPTKMRFLRLGATPAIQKSSRCAMRITAALQ